MTSLTANRRPLPWAASLLIRATLLATVLVAAIERPSRAQDQEFPRLTGHVVDEAEILTPETEARLIDLLAGHESATGNQVVLVTLSSLHDHDISDYAHRLCLYWQGEKEEDNCGALLILVPNERAVRIEVADALAEQLPQSTRRTIIQREIVPYLRRGEVGAGAEHGLRAILAALAGGYIPPPDVSPGAFTKTLGMIVSFAVAGLYLATLVYLLLRRRGRANTLAQEGSSGAIQGAVRHW